MYAQVMYAYVMRPETLPKSYWKFIVKSGPVEEPALEAVRRSIRKLPIDLHAFNAFLKRRGSAAVLATAFPKQVSCLIAFAIPESSMSLAMRRLAISRLATDMVRQVHAMMGSWHLVERGGT